MPILFRNYAENPRYGRDYHRLRGFLLELADPGYPFGRWDWMISHSYLEEKELPKIGIWEDDGAIVGIATFDTLLSGECFLLLKDGYEALRGEMIRYAEKNLVKSGGVKLLIHDSDLAFQEDAYKAGFFPTKDTECGAVFEISTTTTDYILPAGFSIASMKESFDPYQYGRVLWKGFNHERNGEGEFVMTPQKLSVFQNEFDRPNVNLNLKIAVVAPNGSFVSYCGMWQDDASENAYVEPVATDPDYRRLGLGRAAVLEAVRRCGLLGAKRAYVGSSQQFYYSIGFRPRITSTYWKRKETKAP